MGILIDFGSKTIYAGKTIYTASCIVNPNDKTIQFYRNKDVLTYIPPIRVNAEMLSDFRKEAFLDGKNICKI